MQMHKGWPEPKNVPESDVKKNISVVLPFYLNQGMLNRQLAHFALYPEHIKEYIELIVVDDASPSPASLMYATGIDTKLYRVVNDIRWNQHAARNIGVFNSSSGWVLMTDIDHIIPPSTIERLVTHLHCPDTLYRFSRVSAPDMEAYKPHPNSYFLSKMLFEKTGGYDERLTGLYGTDSDFRDRAISHAKDVVLLNDELIRVGREVIADASTTTLTRKSKVDQDKKREIIADRANKKDWAPLFISQDYVRVC